MLKEILSKLLNCKVVWSNKVYIICGGHKILRNLHSRFVLCSASQIYGGDFAKFCGLPRIYELYTFWIINFHEKNCIWLKYFFFRCIQSEKNNCPLDSSATLFKRRKFEPKFDTHFVATSQFFLHYNPYGPHPTPSPLWIKTPHFE